MPRLPVLAGCVVAGLASTALLVPSASTAVTPAATSSRTTALVAKQPTLSHLKITFAKRSNAFTYPTQVTSAADGSGRLFVVEKGGLVKVYKGKGKVQAKPFLDIRNRVLDNGEEGMLGIAFRKDFAKTHHFWVSYVAKNGSLQVSRFTVRSKSSPSAAANTERKVINVPHPTNANHNGGSLAFGNDGYLYIGTGDGGGAGDQPNNAQNTSRLLGKILRIDVAKSCGSKHYCNPTSNPFYGKKAGRDEIWAYGLRNPWRTSVDPKTGTLWIGDVGQDAYEEIDAIPAGKAGWNLGWSCREATHPYRPSRCSSGATLHGPVASYSHAYGSAVTGGFVYRGKTYKKLIAGRYVYADYGSGRVWLRGTSGATRQLATLRHISSFGVNSSGEIYAVTLDGGLYAMKVHKV